MGVPCDAVDDAGVVSKRFGQDDDDVVIHHRGYFRASLGNHYLVARRKNERGGHPRVLAFGLLLLDCLTRSIRNE